MELFKCGKVASKRVVFLVLTVNVHTRKTCDKPIRLPARENYDERVGKRSVQ